MDIIYNLKVYNYKPHIFHFLEKYNIKTSPLPSLALGSVGMSLYDLSKIYTQFFTDGYYITPQFIEYIYVNNKIVFQNNEFIYLLSNRMKKALKDYVSNR